MFVFLVGSGSLAIYQVMSLEDQLDQLTRAIDQMDDKVKHSQYEEAKFFALAKDVLRAAPTDPNAEKVATEFRLRQLQAAKPALMDLSAPDAPAAPARTPSASTNLGGMSFAPATNAAPPHALDPLPPK